MTSRRRVSRPSSRGGSGGFRGGWGAIITEGRAGEDAEADGSPFAIADLALDPDAGTPITAEAPFDNIMRDTGQDFELEGGRG